MINENKDFTRSMELYRSFWNIQKSIMKHVQKTAANNGLSVPQYRILMAMMNLKEMVQKNLREKTNLPKSTLSQAIDGLVQSGLLDRNQVEDNRREIQLSISEKGKSLIRAIHVQDDGIHSLFYNAVESLTEEQFQHLLSMHKQIASSIEKQGSVDQ